MLKCSRDGSFGMGCAMFSSSNLFLMASFMNSALLLYPLIPRFDDLVYFFHDFFWESYGCVFVRISFFS